MIYGFAIGNGTVAIKWVMMFSYIEYLSFYTARYLFEQIKHFFEKKIKTEQNRSWKVISFFKRK